MKNLFKFIIRFIILFVRKWNEAIILFPIAFASICFAPVLIHYVDPTAGVYDLGFMMKFIYAVAGTLICHFTAWIMIKLSFPIIHDYLYHTMQHDLYKDVSTGDVKGGETKHRNECKRLSYSLIVFSLYLFTFILILFTV